MRGRGDERDRESSEERERVDGSESGGSKEKRIDLSLWLRELGREST